MNVYICTFDMLRGNRWLDFDFFFFFAKGLDFEYV